MTTDTRQRRAFSRVPFRLEVRVRVGDATLVFAESRDVSLKGVYVLGAAPLPVGSVCPTELVLGGPCSELVLRVTGRVARADGQGMALEFTELQMDSYLHLHNLVLFNAADPVAIEREFQEHLGLKARPAHEG